MGMMGVGTEGGKGQNFHAVDVGDGNKKRVLERVHPKCDGFVVQKGDTIYSFTRQIKGGAAVSIDDKR